MYRLTYELVEECGTVLMYDGTKIPYQDWEVLFNGERVSSGTFSKDISLWGQIEEGDHEDIVESNLRARRALNLTREMVRLANLGAELERRCQLAEEIVSKTGCSISISRLPDGDRVGHLVAQVRKGIRQEMAIDNPLYVGALV